MEIGLTVIFLFLLAYFFPTLIAMVRGHKNVFALFLANLFFGWSGIGWVVILIWSFLN